MPERPRADVDWPNALRSSEPCSGRKAAALALAVLILAAAAAAAGLAGSGGRLRYPDAFDYAQMGRQLAEGHGFSSLQVFPYVLGWLDAEGLETGPPWPVAWRFPLPILTRAAAFHLLGASDTVALLPALAMSVLTAPLLFLLANRLGGPVAGLLAAALWIASPSQQQLATTGLTEPGAALLAVGVAGLALRARDDPRAGASALLGAALGLAVLQRTNLLALAPVAVAMVAAAPGGARRTRLLALAAAMVAVLAPWVARNLVTLGEPLVNLTSDRGLLRLGLGRDPFYELSIPDRDAVWSASLARYPEGWSLAWLRASAPALLGREFGWLLPLGVLLTVADWRRPRCSAWLLAWSGLLATALVFAPPYPNVLRFYWPYAPLLLALVCGSGLDAGARWAGTRVPARWATWAAWAPAALGVAVLLAFSLFALRRPGATTAPLPPARGRPPEIGWLADRTPPDALVASDVSYAVAWQARRPSVRFAGRLGVIAAIDERIDRIDAFYLSPANARAAAPLREPPLSDLFAAAPAVRGVLFLRRP